jgi:hypothetical protein
MFEMIHFNYSEFNLSAKLYCSFLLVQKRTKKAHPKTKTARFRDGISIEL